MRLNLITTYTIFTRVTAEFTAKAEPGIGAWQVFDEMRPMNVSQIIIDEKENTVTVKIIRLKLGE